MEKKGNTQAHPETAAEISATVTAPGPQSESPTIMASTPELALTSLTPEQLSALPSEVQTAFKILSQQARDAEKRAREAEKRAREAEEREQDEKKRRLNAEEIAVVPIHELDALPRQVRHTITGRPHTSGTRHGTLAPIREEFAKVPINWKRKPADTMLAERKALYFDNEANVRHNVVAVLQSVARCLFSDSEIESVEFDLESIIGGIRPDILVIVARKDGGRWPIGVCEVKQPSPNGSRAEDLDNGQVVAQVTNYMYNLQSLCGIKFPLAILTTYDNWRFLCLPEALDLAKSDTLGPLVTPDEPLQRPSMLDVIPSLDSEERIVVSGDNVEGVKWVDRKVYATRIYSSKDEWPELLSMLGTVLLKMPRSPRTQPVFAQPRSIYLVASSALEEFKPAELPGLSTFRLRTGPLKKISLTDSGVPEQLIVLYLLYQIGEGRDGKVWLAAFPDGRSCLVKFRHREHATPDNDGSQSREGSQTKLMAMVRAEAALWKEIWGLEAYGLSLSGRAAVVMPFLKPVSETEWKSEEICGVVREAVATMVNAGFRHNDVKRDHVGLYQEGGDLKAALFDLADVDKVGPDEREEVQQKALMVLLGPD